MKAAIFCRTGKVLIRDIEKPTARQGQSLSSRSGPTPYAGSTVVILRGEKSAGIDDGVVLGDRSPPLTFKKLVRVLTCVGRPPRWDPSHDPCLECDSLRSRRPEHRASTSTSSGNRANGGLAEYVLISESAMMRGESSAGGPGPRHQRRRCSRGDPSAAF